MNPEVLGMPSRTGVYQFGPFQLDAHERRLLRDGAQVPLRLKAFETLRMLVENAGRLVTKETLLKQVWSDAVVEENNINANVSILRKALGEDANGQSYIETVPRVGYRFVAKVSGNILTTICARLRTATQLRSLSRQNL